jgi:peroxiredoxin Q/BCP
MIVGKERGMKPIATPISTLCVVALAFWACGCSQAAEEGLSVGDPAPVFELPGSDGRTYSLDALAGRTVVVAWFPKAFTGG